jgi:hypothetical protein
LYQNSLDLENYFESEEHQKSVQTLLHAFLLELEKDESNNEEFLEAMSTKLLLDIVPGKHLNCFNKKVIDGFS